MIRVLVVDDSAIARSMITRGLNRYPDIEVIGESPDVYDARDRIVTDDPDVITLDIRMPRMDGVEFLRRLMPQYPKPVVIVSALDKLEAEAVVLALEAGATDVVAKPGAGSGRGVEIMMDELAHKVRSAASADVSGWRNPNWSLPPRGFERIRPIVGERDRIVAVGASTGGTVAINQLLSDLPPTMPGIAMALHMPPVFTEKFAERLSKFTPFNVSEARDGDSLGIGQVLLAPGDRHLSIIRKGRGYVAQLSNGPKVNGHRPSVGTLFSSVAREAGPYGLGILLTGMGRDGASELKEILDVGGRTMAQDKPSSVVWGMPGEAVRLGAAEVVLPLKNIGETLKGFLGEGVK
jgi:two-component system chemotaxis response regulator CheB